MNAKIALGSESNYVMIEKARLYVRISEETIYPQTLFVQKQCSMRKLQKKTMMIFRYRKCRLNFLVASLLREATRDGR
jgi:hypothetical protein